MNTLRFFVIIFVFSFYSCGGAYFSAGDYENYGTEINSGGLPSNGSSSSNIEPAGIPAPVAKSVKPISSTNIIGTSSEFASEMGLTEVPEEESLMILGEAGSVDSGYQIQISNKEGEVVGQFTPNEDGSFIASFPRTLVDFNETLLVKAVDINGNESDPVFVTIHPPGNFLNYPPYTIHVTQLENVPSQNIEMTSAGDIIFNGVDEENKPIIYSMPLQGGTPPKPLAEGFSSSLSHIQASVDGKFFVGFDNKAGHLLRIDLDGTVTQLTPHPVNNHHFKLSPDGKFVAQEVMVENRDVILTFVSTHPNSNRPKSVRLDVPDIHMGQTKSFQVSWVSTNQLVIIREFTLFYPHEDWFRIELIDLENYDLEEFLSFSQSDILTVTPTFLALSPFPLTNIQFNPNDHKVFTFECGNEDGQMEICLKEFTPGYQHLITRHTLEADLGLKVQLMNSQWNASGELILFEMVIIKKEYSEHVIGVYHLATGTYDLLGFGSQLKADPLFPNVVSYLSYDDKGQLQVGVINLAIHPLTKDLF